MRALFDRKKKKEPVDLSRDRQILIEASNALAQRQPSNVPRATPQAPRNSSQYPTSGGVALPRLSGQSGASGASPPRGSITSPSPPVPRAGGPPRGSNSASPLTKKEEGKPRVPPKQTEPDDTPSALRRAVQPKPDQWEYVALYLSKTNRVRDSKIKESRSARPTATTTAAKPVLEEEEFSDEEELYDDDGNLLLPPTYSALGLASDNGEDSDSGFSSSEDTSSGESDYRNATANEKKSSPRKENNTDKKTTREKVAGLTHRLKEKAMRTDVLEQQKEYLKRDQHRYLTAETGLSLPPDSTNIVVNSGRKEEMVIPPAGRPTGQGAKSGGIELVVGNNSKGETVQYYRDAKGFYYYYADEAASPRPPEGPNRNQYQRPSLPSSGEVAAPVRRAYQPVPSTLPPAPVDVPGARIYFQPRHPVPSPQPNLWGPPLCQHHSEPDTSHMVQTRFRDIRWVDSPVRKKRKEKKRRWFR